MHVVVDVAVHEQQVPLELACDLGVGAYVVDERRVALLAYLLLDAVVRLAPPAVVDAVVVVASARYRRLEEVGVLQYRRRRHEASARVPVYAHAVDVNIVIPGSELLDGGFLVGKAVVAQVAVTVVVVPLRTVGVAAAVSHRDDDESCLCQAVGPDIHARIGVRRRLDLRTRVYVVDDGVALRRVEVEGLVHHAIEVRHSVGGLHGEGLGELVSVGQKLREVTRLEYHQLVAEAVVESRFGDGIHTRVVVHEVTAGVVYLRRVEVVSLIEQLHIAAVEADRIEVLVVGVFALLAAHGGEVDCAVFLVHVEDLVYVPRTFGQAAYEVALVVI